MYIWKKIASFWKIFRQFLWNCKVIFNGSPFQKKKISAKRWYTCSFILSKMKEWMNESICRLKGIFAFQFDSTCFFSNYYLVWLGIIASHQINGSFSCLNSTDASRVRSSAQPLWLASVFLTLVTQPVRVTKWSISFCHPTELYTRRQLLPKLPITVHDMQDIDSIKIETNKKENFLLVNYKEKKVITFSTILNVTFYVSCFF